MDATKGKLFNETIHFLEFTKYHMSMLITRFNEDTPSDKMKHEIIESGINVIDTLIEEMNENIDSINTEDLVDIKNRKSALEVEDMLVNLCDRFVGHRSTFKLFAAMTSVEVLLTNIAESMANKVNLKEVIDNE